MDKFIANANITHFAGLFETEADPRRRGQLKTLMIEEENKFGQRSERLEQVLRRIDECNARIARLETILEGYRIQGYEIGPTEQTLRNLRELKRVYEDHHRVIVDGLDRSPLR